MGVIISLINHKGGTSKTQTTVNLGNALANKGFRVLAIDQDPQSNTSKILVGGPKYGGSVESIPRTLFQLYRGEEGLKVEDCIYGTPYEDFYCLPNTTRTNVLEMEMYRDPPTSFLKLRELIRSYAKEHFDFTLIDCPPSLGVWVSQALYCSDLVIVPVEAGSQFSIDGIGPALDLIDSVGSGENNPDLRFLRMLINKVDMRTSVSKSAVDEIRTRFGEDLVFSTTIPISTEIQKAETALTTVLRQAPRSTAAKKYRELAGEVCQILGVQSKKNTPE